MKNKLYGVFDYQRFCQNDHLAKIISETEEKYTQKLSEKEISYDDLEHISAAGNMNVRSKKPFNKEGGDK